MIQFSCRCSHIFHVEEDTAGSSIQCPQCGLLNDVPTLSDLPHVDTDGTYELQPPPTEPNDDQLAQAHRAFSRHRIDSQGNDLDLRATNDQPPVSDTGEIPLEPIDESLITAPKYDPESGELIRSIPVQSDNQPVPADIPLATAGLNYAPISDALATPIRGIWRQLFRPINVAVIAFIYIGHLFFQAALFISTIFIFTIVAAFVTLFFIVAHYGNVIDEIGPGEAAELPRPLRDINWREDLWGPFAGVVCAAFLAYFPAYLCIYLPLPEILIIINRIILIIVGTFFFPAMLLTTLTSGSVRNLRPDRVISVITACGSGYLFSLLLLAISAILFVLSFICLNANWYSMFTAARPFYGHPIIAYPLLAMAVYIMHLFCWHLGLLFRAHYSQFPWVLQYHIPAQPKEKPLRPGLHPKIAAAQAAAQARAAQRKSQEGNE